MACKLLGGIKCYDVRKTAVQGLYVVFIIPGLVPRRYIMVPLVGIDAYVGDSHFLAAQKTTLSWDHLISAGTWPELTYQEALQLIGVPRLDWIKKV